MGVSELLRPSAKVMLGGRERTIYLDYNTFAEIEQATGTNLMEDSSMLAKDSFTSIRLLVWAGLYEESPRPTLHEVGAWLLGDWQDVAAALAKLQAQVFTKKVPGAESKKKRPR